MLSVLTSLLSNIKILVCLYDGVLFSACTFLGLSLNNVFFSRVNLPPSGRRTGVLLPDPEQLVCFGNQQEYLCGKVRFSVSTRLKAVSSVKTMSGVITRIFTL